MGESRHILRMLQRKSAFLFVTIVLPIAKRGNEKQQSTHKQTREEQKSKNQIIENTTPRGRLEVLFSGSFLLTLYTTAPFPLTHTLPIFHTYPAQAQSLIAPRRWRRRRGGRHLSPCLSSSSCFPPSSSSCSSACPPPRTPWTSRTSATGSRGHRTTSRRVWMA